MANARAVLETMLLRSSRNFLGCLRTLEMSRNIQEPLKVSQTMTSLSSIVSPPVPSLIVIPLCVPKTNIVISRISDTSNSLSRWKLLLKQLCNFNIVFLVMMTRQDQQGSFFYHGPTVSRTMIMRPPIQGVSNLLTEQTSQPAKGRAPPQAMNGMFCIWTNLEPYGPI